MSVLEEFGDGEDVGPSVHEDEEEYTGHEHSWQLRVVLQESRVGEGQCHSVGKPVSVPTSMMVFRRITTLSTSVGSNVTRSWRRRRTPAHMLTQTC